MSDHEEAAAEGARAFRASGDAYDAYMGRWSRLLADQLADLGDVAPGRGLAALDVGCGPGALTRVLVERLGASAVSACDPSPEFVAACRERHPDVDVRPGRAERLPFGDGTFDRVLAQLVLHFVSDPDAAAAELRRVLRPGGVAAACVWESGGADGGMELLRRFWDAALEVDPGAPDEASTLRFGRPGEIADLLAAAGFVDVREARLTVRSTYAGFDELWGGFLLGIGPAGSWCASQTPDRREEVRAELHRRLGRPDGPVTLTATAVAAAGRAPG